MKKVFKTILVAGALLAPFCTMASSVLWFSVIDTATVVDSKWRVSTVGAYTDTDGNPINAARVRITGAGIPDDTFLQLYYEDESGWQTIEGLDTTILDDGAALWQPADLGENPDSSATVSLEVGYVNLEDAMAEFIAVAFAESTIEELSKAGYISTGGVSTQTETPWIPWFFNPVPEPSTGLLLAIGACMLALRRRPRTDKEQTR